MLSSFILGNQKLVLFVDHEGIEVNSMKILEKLLSGISYEIFGENIQFTATTAVVLRVAKLEIDRDDTSIITLIQKLKLNRSVTQVFLFATVKNISSSILIPLLEHMSDIVLNIESRSLLTILTKRKYGSVKLKSYQHDLMDGGTSVREILPQKQVVTNDPAINPPEVAGTFKIGDFSSAELEAKKKLKLPFEIMWVFATWNKIINMIGI